MLLCWGPPDLGRWLAKRPPSLCVFVAHGEGYWTRQILEGCRPVIDHVVAVSTRVKDRVAGGLPTTVIPNGVDLAHLARTRPAGVVRKSLGFRADDFVLGYVGRFSDEKQPHLLVDAVARLPAPFKASLFVGWGPLGGRLLAYANARIPGRYAFVKATNDVGDYYAALDALCLPSAEEGFGLVILEAMLCERPIIATEVGCVPDLIADRVNGLVVAGTPESIRDAALLLRDNPAWARGLAAQGRAHAEARGQAHNGARLRRPAARTLEAEIRRREGQRHRTRTLMSFTQALREFWTVPTLDEAKHERVTVPPQPETWTDAHQSQIVDLLFAGVPLGAG